MSFNIVSIELISPQYDDKISVEVCFITRMTCYYSKSNDIYPKFNAYAHSTANALGSGVSGSNVGYDDHTDDDYS